MFGNEVNFDEGPYVSSESSANEFVFKNDPQEEIESDHESVELHHLETEHEDTQSVAILTNHLRSLHLRTYHSL